MCSGEREGAGGEDAAQCPLTRLWTRRGADAGLSRGTAQSCTLSHTG